jgi:hypothetical protein
MLQNSWGPSWGMDGFVLIERGKAPSVLRKCFESEPLSSRGGIIQLGLVTVTSACVKKDWRCRKHGASPVSSCADTDAAFPNSASYNHPYSKFLARPWLFLLLCVYVWFVVVPRRQQCVWR